MQQTISIGYNSKYRFNSGNNNIYVNTPASIVPITSTPPSRIVQQRAIEAGRSALRGNALENNRPQYYAERNLPLFEDGAAINSGLIKTGWSHGNGQPNVSVNIPTMNVNLDDYFTTTPRRGGGNGTNSAPTSTGLPHVRQSLPAVARPRTSLAVEANLDPGKVPASVVETAHRQAADARQYGEYAGVTPRDWL